MAKQRAETAALNAHKKSVADVERAGKEAKEKLAAIKADMKQASRDFGEILALKTFSLQDVGKGKTNKTDLEKAKKIRHEVLGKMSLVGPGLSADQTRDFEFFKSNWDDVNEAALGAAWPEKFAELAQTVQDAIASGESNAFSKFMHSETLRCLSEIPRLRL